MVSDAASQKTLPAKKMERACGFIPDRARSRFSAFSSLFSVRMPGIVVKFFNKGAEFAKQKPQYCF